MFWERNWSRLGNTSALISSSLPEGSFLREHTFQGNDWFSNNFSSWQEVQESSGHRWTKCPSHPPLQYSCASSVPMPPHGLIHTAYRWYLWLRAGHCSSKACSLCLYSSQEMVIQCLPSYLETPLWVHQEWFTLLLPLLRWQHHCP